VDGDSWRCAALCHPFSGTAGGGTSSLSIQTHRPDRRSLLALTKWSGIDSDRHRTHGCGEKRVTIPRAVISLPSRTQHDIRVKTAPDAVYLWKFLSNSFEPRQPAFERWICTLVWVSSALPISWTFLAKFSVLRVFLFEIHFCTHNFCIQTPHWSSSPSSFCRSTAYV
jgi:hypothetical protein